MKCGTFYLNFFSCVCTLLNIYTCKYSLDCKVYMFYIYNVTMLVKVMNQFFLTCLKKESEICFCKNVFLKITFEL